MKEEWDDHEKLLLLLGAIARDFSAIEDFIEFYIEAFVGHPDVAQVFLKTLGFKNKCDRLRDMVKIRFDAEEERKPFDLWIKDCEKSAALRNEWLHTAYTKDDEDKIGKLRRNISGNSSDRINLDDLYKDWEFIKDVLNRGYKLPEDYGIIDDENTFKIKRA